MSEPCGLKSSTGPCRYPADNCPVHGTRQYGVPVNPPATLAGFYEESGDEDDEDYAFDKSIAALLRNIARSGKLSPRDTATLLDAAEDHESRGSPASLREVELRGRLMQGLTPRDAEEWALCESIFDDTAIAEFHRWDEVGTVCATCPQRPRETFG